ncbi:putative laccase [Tanacetum coccineum]
MHTHLLVLSLLAALCYIQSQAALVRYTFVVQETNYTRLCSSKNILTVNGQYPGPTISARRGDTVIVDAWCETAKISILMDLIFITQCQIQPVVSPKIGTTYPFPKPHAEVPVILDFLRSGGDPLKSDALTINGQPGDRYNCSRQETTKVKVDQGKTYMLRMVNAAMNNIINASFSFTRSLRSLASSDHPVDVPMKITRKLLYTLSINTLPCDNNSVCAGPQGRRFAASINNITFDAPKTSILGAYYRGMNGVYGDDFPDNPPFIFNYTSDSLNSSVQTPMNGTEVKILKYNDTVELVFQGTNVVSGILVGSGMPFWFRKQSWSMVHALSFRATCKLGNGDGIHCKEWQDFRCKNVTPST